MCYFDKQHPIGAFLISNSYILCQCFSYSSNVAFGITKREWRSTFVQVVHTINPYLTFVEHDEYLFSPCQMPNGRIGMSHDAIVPAMVNVPVIIIRQLAYLIVNRLFV